MAGGRRYDRGMKPGLAMLAVALLASIGCGGGDEPPPAGSVDLKVIGGEELHRVLYADLAPDGVITDFILIDTRTRKEFVQRSLPGAVNVSYLSCGEANPGRYDFQNALTGKTGPEALTWPDGRPFPKDARLLFYASRAG